LITREIIGTGTREVQINLGVLTPAELSNLLSVTCKIQKPSGEIETINVSTAFIYAEIVGAETWRVAKFNYNFEQPNTYTVQTTLNYTGGSVTSADALVLDVQNPVPLIQTVPQGQYINKNDLVIYLGDERLSEASDRYEGVIDDNAKIQQAIDFAENRAMSFLAARYAMPITCGDGKTPKLLKEILIMLATWQFYEQHPPEEVDNRYKEAMAMLDRLAKGTIKLVCDNGTCALPNALPSTSSVYAASPLDIQGFCSPNNGCGYA